MLELPSFGHMTTPTKQFVSRDKNLVADFIKIVTMFIKQHLKISRKLKQLEFMY